MNKKSLAEYYAETAAPKTIWTDRAMLYSFFMGAVTGIFIFFTMLSIWNS